MCVKAAMYPSIYSGHAPLGNEIRGVALSQGLKECIWDSAKWPL